MADSKKYNGSTWEHSLRKLTTATDTFTTLPADIYADGNNATVGISGNTVQSGTPTPSNPIVPEGTGERTANLFELTDSSATADTLKTLVDFGEDVTFDTITCSCVFENLEAEVNYGAFLDYLMNDGTHQYVALASMRNANDDSRIPTNVKVNGNYYNTKQNITFRKIQAYLYPTGYNKFKSGSIKWAFYDSEKKDYEPYGYKIGILSANTTTPVYLGEVQTTRKIKKLVLTGEENWMLYALPGAVNVERFYIVLSQNAISGGNIIVSTHFPTKVDNSDTEHIRCGGASSNEMYIYISRLVATTSAELKSYLAAQYAAGTPVCVWYVLANEETAVVNEPLMKIDNYADEVSGITVPTITGKDTFDVDTTLKPSEVSLSYTGWHDATVEEWDGSQWQ